MAASHAQDRQDKRENSRLNYKQQTANINLLGLRLLRA